MVPRQKIFELNLSFSPKRQKKFEPHVNCLAPQKCQNITKCPTAGEKADENENEKENENENEKENENEIEVSRRRKTQFEKKIGPRTSFQQI